MHSLCNVYNDNCFLPAKKNLTFRCNEFPHDAVPFYTYVSRLLVEAYLYVRKIVYIRTNYSLSLTGVNESLSLMRDKKTYASSPPSHFPYCGQQSATALQNKWNFLKHVLIITIYLSLHHCSPE